jgi:hypothetical protein
MRSTCGITHEWCAPGVPLVKDMMQNYPVEDVPFIAKVVSKREMFFVPSAEDLPPAWDAEKRELLQQKVQSTLALPLVKGESLLGYFGFDSVRIRRDLDAEVLEILRILANILADALERDLLEKRILAARDEAERMALAKGEFLANMSHEIRTPMNGVQGMLELLLESPLLEEQRFYAETARDSAESLLTILNDILDFSKIEAGKLDLQLQRCSLLDILDDLGGILGIKARDKGIELFLRDALLPGEAGYPETLEEALGWPKLFGCSVIMLVHRGSVQSLPPGALCSSEVPGKSTEVPWSSFSSRFLWSTSRYCSFWRRRGWRRRCACSILSRGWRELWGPGKFEKPWRLWNSLYNPPEGSLKRCGRIWRGLSMRPGRGRSFLPPLAAKRSLDLILVRQIIS